MSAAADFADRFTVYWQAPSVDGLDGLLAPEVELVAPMIPVTRDLTAGKAAFGRLLRLLPDLTGTVSRWGETNDGVLIEFTLSGTAGGVRLSWEAVDRFVLRGDGLATVRVNYFDSAKLARTVLANPRAWPSFLRLRRR
ncbi:MAG TPA: nuclear transport factor 2 family protein [Solirubrobacterales bacterium]|nr:nuclear transport factor 2 family protein [Solirubrobacterales bacterium]